MAAKRGFLTTLVAASLAFAPVTSGAVPDNQGYSERCEEEVLPVLGLADPPGVIKVVVGQNNSTRRLPKSFNGMYCQFSYPGLNVYVSQRTRKVDRKINLAKAKESPCGEASLRGKQLAVFMKAPCGFDFQTALASNN
jgi:hypothetical protein